MALGRVRGEVFVVLEVIVDKRDGTDVLCVEGMSSYESRRREWLDLDLI